MVTDTDIKKFKAALAPEFKQLRSEIKDVNDKVSGLKTRIDTFEDNITGDVAELRNEISITSSYRNRLEDHETRLIIVESRSAS